MAKDIFKPLIDGIYMNECSYIFHFLKKDLEKSNVVKLTRLDIERLTNYILNLNNEIEGLKLELSVRR